MEKTWKQQQRQITRNKNGRYKALNPCELCKKSVGANYFSDPRSGGEVLSYHGLVLCSKCCGKTTQMSDEEVRKVFKLQ